MDTLTELINIIKHRYLNTTTAPKHIADTKDDQYPSITDAKIICDLHCTELEGYLCREHKMDCCLLPENFFDEDDHSNFYTRKITFTGTKGASFGQTIERYELIERDVDCTAAFCTFVNGRFYQRGYNPSTLTEDILNYWVASDIILEDRNTVTEWLASGLNEPYEPYNDGF
jgi:hypothetical protein